MSHQRRRPFRVESKKTRGHRPSAQRLTRSNSPPTSASAADSTTGIMRPANASPTGTKLWRNEPSSLNSTRRCPALRPRTRLISTSASARAFSTTAPRSASARSAARTRRASTRAAAAPAGCCSARREMPLARSESRTPAVPSHCMSASKSRSTSTRTPRRRSSVFTKSSHRRSPMNTKVVGVPTIEGAAPAADCAAMKAIGAKHTWRAPPGQASSVPPVNATRVTNDGRYIPMR